MRTGEHVAPPTIRERVAAAREHLEMSIRWKGESLAIAEMKRHYTNYFKGIAHFKDYRMKLVTSFDLTEILETLEYVAEHEGDFDFAH